MAERVRAHEEVLDELVALDGRDVVDIGCGAGALARWMRDRGARVTGVECSETLRARARAADPDHADRYVDGIAQALPLPDHSVDLAVFSYSLHHVPVDAMAASLDEVARVLRPDGEVYVVEPRPKGPDVEAARLVVDESAEQEAAQRLLDRAVADGWAETATSEYASESAYESFEEWSRLVVDIDPGRAERMHQHAAETKRRFDALAERRDGAFVFPQRNIVRVLHAPKAPRKESR